MYPKITHHDGDDVRRLEKTVIIPLYEASHAEQLNDPFYSTARFSQRLHAYAARPGFALVVAHGDDGHPLGQAFGFALSADSPWWRGLVSQVPAGFTSENGARTFALAEIMVHPESRRQGIAKLLHDELLATRREQRATLLVRADNTAAATYAHWGWRAAANLQPFPDSPVYRALVVDLPR